MLRTCRNLGLIGFPLLIAACGEESSPPPSGPAAEPPPRAISPLPPVTASRLHVRGLGGEAFFSWINECKTGEAFVAAAELAAKAGPGQPERGPWAVVFVLEFDFCRGMVREIVGETTEASFEAAPGRLDAARLHATIPAFDFLNEVNVQVEVDVAWTAAGEMASTFERRRLRGDGFVFTVRQHGTVRDAEAVGTLAVDGETIASDVDGFALISQFKRGELTLSRTP